MKKLIAMLVAAAAAAAVAAPAPKMSFNGNSKPEEVVEKDGVYTLTPAGKVRIQMSPDKKIPVYSGAEVEITAEVSGAGNIELGAHLYNKSHTWRNGVGSKMTRVDAEESETIRKTVKIEKEDIFFALPFLSCYSGSVKVYSISARVKGGLDAENVKAAPVVAGWKYMPYARAVKCQMTDNGLQLCTGRGQLAELVSTMVSAKDGDKFQFTGEISGKNAVSIGLHLYGKKRNWIGTVWVQVKVNGKLDKFPEVTVKTPKGKMPVAAVVPVIRVNQLNDITIKTLDAKMIK